MIPLRPGQTFTFKIGEAEFQIRAITGAEAMEVADQLDRLKDAGAGSAVLRRAYEIAACLITSWSNLTTAKGVAIPYATENAATWLAQGTTFLEARAIIQAALAGMSEEQRGK